MRVRVRLFASLRELAGRPRGPGRAPSRGRRPRTRGRPWPGDYPALAAKRANLTASVNRRYAPFDTPLAEGDEVVFIPPVSGG